MHATYAIPKYWRSRVPKRIGGGFESRRFHQDYAAVAQLVEQQPEKLCVTGSIPVCGTIHYLFIEELYRDDISSGEEHRRLGRGSRRIENRMAQTKYRMTRTLYKNINWTFNPLIDMDLSRFQLRFTEVNKADINPEFLLELEKVNLKLIFTGIFYAPPGCRSSIHVDGKLNEILGPWPSRFKLNWTNIGTTDSRWYDILDEDRIGSPIRTDVNSDFVDFSFCKKKLLMNANLTGWHLFESGMPHGVVNNSKDLRWCISSVVQDVVDNTPWPTLELLLERLCPESAAGEAILLTSGKMQSSILYPGTKFQLTSG